MLTLKNQYFKLNYWTSQTCCFVKSSPNIYKSTFWSTTPEIITFRTRFSPIYVSKDLCFILLLNHSLRNVCHHNCVELYRASASFLLPSEDSKQRVYDSFSPASKSLPEHEKHIREHKLEWQFHKLGNRSIAPCFTSQHIQQRDTNMFIN